MTDETVEYTEVDQADILQMYGEPDGGAERPDLPEPSFHTVLEVWREVLKPAAQEATKKVTPQWANRMVASYAQLTFADMNDLRDLYFFRIGELAGIVDAEIAVDDQALRWSTPEEDAVENAAHYKGILTEWQCKFLGWELAWDCASPGAAVELAAISEVHKMFFGQTGLTQFLDNIRFEFTDADQAELAGALEELRLSVEGVDE